MSLIFSILGILILLLYISKKKSRWIKYGQYRGSRHITINGHQYYLEKVKFKDYQDAIHHYFKIVADISAYADALEVRYDYYDWSNTIFRFEHTTIKLIRCIDKVLLIKSKKPISIEDLELDNSSFRM
ncbi:hypothetical protein DET65_3557 [Sunxiuqinia elliptica]|uniref:Uncharacterized protein n=1 Tax=Sunxiuqinia elliptica TaxID=655355 RepID=A0A4V3BY65_9BACT|nr:hypothetical protein DET52_105308 [Sunxiuqinia elliptica]TDO57960.1 hypothetical protein DET65_3557 [Sunxiuqinia elliptica]